MSARAESLEHGRRELEAGERAARGQGARGVRRGGGKWHLRARGLQRHEAAGAGACRVGEALMREADVGAALRRLRRES
jgi:hypothetical protein